MLTNKILLAALAIGVLFTGASMADDHVWDKQPHTQQYTVEKDGSRLYVIEFIPKGVSGIYCIFTRNTGDTNLQCFEADTSSSGSSNSEWS